MILGVDPGFKGAMALYNPATKTCEGIFDMPLYPSAGRVKKNELDITSLAIWLGLHAPSIDFAVIEKVHAMTYMDARGETRGQGAKSSFEFGRSTGIVQGVIATYHIQTYMVAPAVWKAGMNLSANKQESLDKAIALFPNDRVKFLRKKDDGRAEALLLAVFASKFIRQRARTC